MQFYIIAIRRAVTNATCLLSQPLEIQAYRDLSLDELAERTDEAKHKLGDRVIVLGHNYQRDEVIRHADVEGDSKKRTPADNATVRNVYVVGPDKKIKLVLVYPMTTGRNFDEVLRVIDSLQLTAKHQVATPVNWKQGDDVIIAGSVSDEEAKKRYPQGWKAPKPYLRIVPQPQ